MLFGAFGSLTVMILFLKWMETHTWRDVLARLAAPFVWAWVVFRSLYEALKSVPGKMGEVSPTDKAELSASLSRFF